MHEAPHYISQRRCRILASEQGNPRWAAADGERRGKTLRWSSEHDRRGKTSEVMARTSLKATVGRHHPQADIASTVARRSDQLWATSSERDAPIVIARMERRDFAVESGGIFRLVPQATFVPI